MKLNRRNTLIGLGTIVAGGGAALGTGAFSSVEADRSVTVQTAGDSDALLRLEPNNDYDGEIITGGDGDQLEINIFGEDSSGGDIATTEGASGVNQNAATTIEDLVDMTNQGTETINEISFSVSGGGDDILSVVPEEITSADMDPGDTESFGIEIDLTDDDSDAVTEDGDINDGNFEPVITIEAGDTSD